MALAGGDLFDALEGVENEALWDALAQSMSGSDGSGGTADAADGGDALWEVALGWAPAAPPSCRRQQHEQAQLRCVDAAHAADCTRCAGTAANPGCYCGPERDAH
jgi:hypothetical protein